ncbi:hypothetical protein AA313_de0207193 [Arthrobotrys entomopaga]|nr:hypothetical protein AA313_de0207193 [Arthrobotrys entomopaga]
MDSRQSRKGGQARYHRCLVCWMQDTRVELLVFMLAPSLLLACIPGVSPLGIQTFGWPYSSNPPKKKMGKKKLGSKRSCHFKLYELARLRFGKLPGRRYSKTDGFLLHQTIVCTRLISDSRDRRLVNLELGEIMRDSNYHE